MNRHVPTCQTQDQTMRQNNCHWISLETRVAKHRRRRLEQRYHRTRAASDKRAYDTAVSAAHDSIMKSKAECFRSSTQQAIDVLQQRRLCSSIVDVQLVLHQ